jgi:hypothetical protein
MPPGRPALADGTIGALGEDGSFGDDHRFHPFSENYQDQGSCAPLDARGHGFTNTIIWGLPTSAMAGGGCLAAFSRRNQIPCPTQETRDVYFGLLGPETASLSYVSGGGRTVTVPTVGPDGAYLIVTRARPDEQQSDSSGFVALLRTGPIRAVTYRDGHTCRPTAVYPCGPIGLVPAKAPHLTQAALASPIHVREMPARSSTPSQLLFKISYTLQLLLHLPVLPQRPNLPRVRRRLGNDHQHPGRATTGRQRRRPCQLPRHPPRTRQISPRKRDPQRRPRARPDKPRRHHRWPLQPPTPLNAHPVTFGQERDRIAAPGRPRSANLTRVAVDRGCLSSRDPSR